MWLKVTCLARGVKTLVTLLEGKPLVERIKTSSSDYGNQQIWNFLWQNVSQVVFRVSILLLLISVY